MSLAQSPQRPPPNTAGESQYWLALFGGALAWLAHLLASYALAEFGCESMLVTYSYLEISAVAWGLLALTVVTATVAGGSALLAFQIQPTDRGDNVAATNLVARHYAARAGLIADVAFTLVILVESVPIFYYLQHCN